MRYPRFSDAEMTRRREEFTLEENMAMVIQPNVITKDERAGVQTGELILVTAGGAERLHDYERGLLRLGG
jgi:Xaa-Pro aminopeptidase